MRESIFAVEEGGNLARRWSPFQAFLFVFIAALGSWGFIALLIYMLMD